MPQYPQSRKRRRSGDICREKEASSFSFSSYPTHLLRDAYYCYAIAKKKPPLPANATKQQVLEAIKQFVHDNPAHFSNVLHAAHRKEQLESQQYRRRIGK